MAGYKSLAFCLNSKYGQQVVPAIVLQKQNKLKYCQKNTSERYNHSLARVVDGMELEGLEWYKEQTSYKNGWTEIKYTVKIKVINSSEILAKQSEIQSIKNDLEV
jgi:hypothetical protein